MKLRDSILSNEDKLITGVYTAITLCTMYNVHVLM